MLHSIDILSTMKNAKMVNLFRFRNVPEMPMSLHFTICTQICCLSDVLDVPVCECQYLRCQWESVLLHLCIFIYWKTWRNKKEIRRKKRALESLQLTTQFQNFDIISEMPIFLQSLGVTNSRSTYYVSIRILTFN